MKTITSKKGISPIIATLLLILIAIAAGVIVYAYVVGFVGSTTSGSSNKTILAYDQYNLAGGAALVNNQVSAYVKNSGTSSEIYSISTTGLVSGYLQPSGGTSEQLQLAVLVTVTSAWTEGTGSFALSIASTTSFSFVYTAGSDSGKLLINFMGQTSTITGTTSGTTTLTFTIPSTLSATSGSLTLNTAATTTIPTSAAGVKLNELVGSFPASLTMTQPISSIQGFTMAPQSGATAVVSGTTYALQVVGNDGAQITGSAKAV